MSDLKQFQQQVPGDLYRRWEDSGFSLPQVIEAGLAAQGIVTTLEVTGDGTAIEDGIEAAQQLATHLETLETENTTLRKEKEDLTQQVTALQKEVDDLGKLPADGSNKSKGTKPSA